MEASFKKALEDFKGMDSGNRDFTEAWKKKEPYYYKRHNTLIVPSVVINRYFGCNLYRMSPEIVELLQKNGARRACRQVYENGQQLESVQVWVFNCD